MKGRAELRNALTVDLEEFFHAHNLSECWPEARWPSAPRRAAAMVDRVLELLDRHAVTATWFVLGWMADHEPDLVRRLADAGQEVASHGYGHGLVYQQDPETFRADLCRATEAIERVTGTRPTAFRAPCFSVRHDSLWALDVVRQCGYEIDSSVFPLAWRSYGIPDFRREPHRLPNGLIEFPLTVLGVLGHPLPLAGGGYTRLLPNWLVLRLLRRVNRGGRPICFYSHPWEFDCEEPRSPITSVSGRFRHYVGRRSLLPLLERLLGEFSWGPISEVASEHVDPE